MIFYDDNALYGLDCTCIRTGNDVEMICAILKLIWDNIY